MYSIDEFPFFWIVELSVGLVLLFALQVLFGSIAWFIARISLPLSIRYALVVIACTLLGSLAFFVFDPHTHLVPAIIAAVSFGFVTPLQAFAHVYRAHCASIAHPIMMSSSDVKWNTPTAFTAVVLRIAIPSSIPSSLNPPEPPAYHFRRALFNITIVSMLPQYFDAITAKGGIVTDLYGLLVLLCGANGALSATSGVLGLLGEQSPCPFRSPLTSTTMARFWSGKWNAPVSDGLRMGIYYPLLNANVPRPLATLACFVTSGVCHEIILLFAGIRDSRGEWFTFFTLAGIATLAEGSIHRKLPASKFIRWLFSFITLFTLFHMFFLPITLRTGLAREGVKSLSAGRFIITTLLERFLSATSSP